MAATKLTLSVKSDSLPLVKKYAKRQHTSVSKLVQNLFDSIAEKEKDQVDPLIEKYKNAEIPDWIKQLVIAKEPIPDFDHKAEYHKHLEEKYGL
jgi:hypothetical protein